MKNTILDAIRNHAASETQNSLGNRQSYIGASDLATAKSCLRKVAFSKAGLSVETEDEESLLMKQRGHWYEAGILSALFAANKRVIPQLEIVFMVGEIQHIFHLDFVVLEENETQVVELKTTRDENAVLRDSYEFQLQIQITALHRFWNQKAFRIHNAAQLRTFPELVKSLWNGEVMATPHITGHVLVFSTRDKMEPYGPYHPADDEFWGEVTSLSRQIVQAAKQPEKTSFARGFYALCDYCPQQGACPKYKAVEVQSLSPTLEKLFRVKEAIATLETAKTGLEESLKGYYGKVQSLLPKGQYLQCTAGKYKVAYTSKKTYSEAAFLEALQGELEEIMAVIEEIRPLISPDSGNPQFVEKVETLIQLFEDNLTTRIMAKAVRHTPQTRLTLVQAV